MLLYPGVVGCSQYVRIMVESLRTRVTWQGAQLKGQSDPEPFARQWWPLCVHQQTPETNIILTMSGPFITRGKETMVN